MGYAYHPRTRLACPHGFAVGRVRGYPCNRCGIDAYLLILESYIGPMLNRKTIVFWGATNLQGKVLGRPKLPKAHAPARKLYSLRRYDGSRLGCMPFLWVATNELPRSKSVNNRTCSKRLFHELPIWLWIKNKKTQIKML